jgi:predicted N-acetyltransferase YhbS
MTIETRIQGLTYRSLQNPTDLDKLERLFRESYPGEDSKGVFNRFVHWIDSSPSGPGVQLVACDGQKIVGSLSFLRQTVTGFDETYSGFLASTAMTAPENRGKGIYKNLTRLAFKELPKHGADFVFGYTVQESVLRTEMKLGYTLIGDSAVLAFPLNPGKILQKFPYWNWAGAWINGIGKWGSRVYLRLRYSTIEDDISIVLDEVKEFPKEIDSISEAKKQLTQYEALKDSIHLNWKYRDFFRAKERHHFVIAKKGDQVVGWGVCGKMDMKGLKGLAILDVSAIPDFEEETLAAIVKHQILLAIEMDLEIIGCMVDQNSKLFKILRDLGFFRTSQRFKAIFFPLVDNLSGHLTETKNWRHTWGSSDTL